MNPIDAFTTAWQKSFNYSGKATRSEYWWFTLFNGIILVLIYGVSMAAAISAENPAPAAFVIIYGIAQIFPTLSVSVRRLHDVGKEGIWFLIYFVPCIGPFWFLYLMVQPSIGG